MCKMLVHAPMVFKRIRDAEKKGQDRLTQEAMNDLKKEVPIGPFKLIKISSDMYHKLG